MKVAVSVDDRTYSMTVPWWLLAVMLLVGFLWQPATAWATDRFDDVPNSNIFHDDIDWMADAGVTAGCNPPANDEFCPGDNVTREQMAAFIRRLETNGVFMRADEVESRLSALESDVVTLQSRNSALQSDVATLQSKNSALESDVASLETLLAGVSRNGDLLTFAGMNVQVVNGTGSTDGGPNGLGNLIIGYNAQRFTPAERTGSHYLVVGDEHEWTAFGGIVAGLHSTASGDSASVIGGEHNTASGDLASVSGGAFNVASGTGAWVSGGVFNEASGVRASVSGGTFNDASGTTASVSGGNGNDASGARASVSGGNDNEASGTQASILGGNSKVVTATNECYPVC